MHCHISLFRHVYQAKEQYNTRLPQKSSCYKHENPFTMYTYSSGAEYYGDAANLLILYVHVGNPGNTCACITGSVCFVIAQWE